MTDAIPFRVFGHPRSGNHLLAYTVWRTFCPDADLSVSSLGGTGHWSGRQNGDEHYCGGTGAEAGRVRYGRILGRRLHDFPAQGVSYTNAIYIIRDGRDVALSLYRWTEMRHVERRQDDLETYLRTPVDWTGTPATRRAESADDWLVWDHWREHVQAWVATNALMVRYENLVLRPDLVMARVARHFGLPSPENVQAPEPVGCNPSQQARVQTELPPSLRQLFDQRVPSNFVGRWSPSLVKG